MQRSIALRGRLVAVAAAITMWTSISDLSLMRNRTVRAARGAAVLGLAVPEIRDKLPAMGSTVVGSSPERFGGYTRSESAKWAKLIATAKIQAQ